ncbi:MAG: DUF3817 domain-containing protein [Bdellovibrionota bacterium]
MLKIFRIVAFLEGLSFLLLLFVGVPVKYLMGNPVLVKALGMPHGLLFVGYVVLAVNLYVEFDWPKKKLGWALLASILPFGTFVFDRKYLAHPKG